jgi:hypothetical protein
MEQFFKKKHSFLDLTEFQKKQSLTNSNIYDDIKKFYHNITYITYIHQSPQNHCLILHVCKVHEEVGCVINSSKHRTDMKSH